MKTWKLVSLNFAGLAALVSLVSALVLNRSAGAARVDVVPRINVQNLESFQGKYLQVLYTVGRYPTFPTSLNQIQVIQIKSQFSLPIVSDALSLPAVSVEKQGLFPTYNLVILIVTDQKDFRWENYDHSPVENNSGNGTNEYVSVNIIPRFEIEAVVPRTEFDGIYPHTYQP